MRHVAGRVVRRMQHVLLADALGGWVDHVSWVVHSKGLVDRMLTMWTQRGLSRAIAAWVHVCAQSNRVRRALFRISSRQLSLSFDAWLAATLDARNRARQLESLTESGTEDFGYDLGYDLEAQLEPDAFNALIAFIKSLHDELLSVRIQLSEDREKHQLEDRFVAEEHRVAASQRKQMADDLNDVRGQLRACVEAHGKQLQAEEERRMRAQASAQLLANKHSQLAAEMDSLRSEKIRLAAKLSAELSEQQEKLRLQQETVDAIRFARTEHAARASEREKALRDRLLEEEQLRKRAEQALAQKARDAQARRTSNGWAGM